MPRVLRHLLFNAEALGFDIFVDQGHTGVHDKNVKPGVYYLTGRAYVKGYAKNYTKWSEVKKIVVK